MNKSQKLVIMFLIMFCDKQTIVNNQEEELSKFNGNWVPVKIEKTDSSGNLIEDSVLNLTEIEVYIKITNSQYIDEYTMFEPCLKIQTINTVESGDSLVAFDKNMDTNNIYILYNDTLITSLWIFGYCNTIYLYKYADELPPIYWPTDNCKNHSCIENKTCDELKIEIDSVLELYQKTMNPDKIVDLHDELRILNDCYQMVCP